MPCACVCMNVCGCVCACVLAYVLVFRTDWGCLHRDRTLKVALHVNLMHRGRASVVNGGGLTKTCPADHTAWSVVCLTDCAYSQADWFLTGCLSDLLARCLKVSAWMSVSACLSAEYVSRQSLDWDGSSPLGDGGGGDGGTVFQFADYIKSTQPKTQKCSRKWGKISSFNFPHKFNAIGVRNFSHLQILNLLTTSLRCSSCIWGSSPAVFGHIIHCLWVGSMSIWLSVSLYAGKVRLGHLCTLTQKQLTLLVLFIF